MKSIRRCPPLSCKIPRGRPPVPLAAHPALAAPPNTQAVRAHGLAKCEILAANVEAVAMAQAGGADEATVVAECAVAAGEIDEPELPLILRMNEGVFA